MTETDDLSARLAALETVLRHLVTHLALHSDDPPRWVATRRVLALHEVQEQLARHEAQAPLNQRRDFGAQARFSSLEQAITGFFDPVEGVLGAYAADRKGTHRTTLR